MAERTEVSTFIPRELWGDKSEELRQVAAKALELSTLTRKSLEDKVEEINKEQRNLLNRKVSVFTKEFLKAGPGLKLLYSRVVSSDFETTFGIEGTYRGITSVDIDELDTASLPAYAQRDWVIPGMLLINAQLSETNHLGNVVVPFSAIESPILFS